MHSVSVAITSIWLLFILAISEGGQPTEDGLPDLVISSKDNYWQAGTFSSVTGGTADITIDEKSKKQVWEGFGGTFNEAGWDALSAVSAEIPTALTLLFDPHNGAHFIYGRIPIGASDYAMNLYSLAETANDYTMEYFSIARDREKLIPYIKAARAINPDLHLWASPWTPPSWMMDISKNMKSDAQTQEAYALYFAKFVEEYGKEDLTIEAIHPQNEPGYALVKWTTPLFINFIKNYLGPKFVARNLKTQIWCGTMSHPDDAEIAKACMNDNEAMKYVTGFGLQWNLESVVGTLSQKGRVWQTEHRCGNYNFEAKYWDQSRYDPNKPQNDHLYGEESWQLIRDWIVAGVNSYSAWNMVLDTDGKNLSTWHQNALLVVDRSAKKLIVTPAYYVFRHFSQYIDSGAIRIGSSGSDDVLAFMNPDGSIITEIYNKNDASKNMTISVSGSMCQLTVPAHAWATLRMKPMTSAYIHNQKMRIVDECELVINRTGDGYRIALPSRESGRLELLTVTGRVLSSMFLSQRSPDVLLPKRNLPTGLLVIRVTYGSLTKTARLNTIY